MADPKQPPKKDAPPPKKQNPEKLKRFEDIREALQDFNKERANLEELAKNKRTTPAQAQAASKNTKAAGEKLVGMTFDRDGSGTVSSSDIWATMSDILRTREVAGKDGKVSKEESEELRKKNHIGSPPAALVVVDGLLKANGVNILGPNKADPLNKIAEAKIVALLKAHKIPVIDTKALPSKEKRAEIVLEELREMEDARKDLTPPNEDKNVQEGLELRAVRERNEFIRAVFDPNTDGKVSRAEVDKIIKEVKIAMEKANDKGNILPKDTLSVEEKTTTPAKALAATNRLMNNVGKVKLTEASADDVLKALRDEFKLEVEEGKSPATPQDTPKAPLPGGPRQR